MITPFAFERYSTMHEMAKWVLSQQGSDINGIRYGDNVYDLEYEEKCITSVYFKSNLWGCFVAQPALTTGFGIWQHGVQKIRTNFHKLKPLFEKIIKLDREKILDNPNIFYDLLIEFLWLLGNTTITQRGTGSIVEKFSIYLQKCLGIDPRCILKLGKQRDCLNLTFPLPFFKKIFLFFCEPDSLLPGTIDYMLNLLDKDALVEDFVTRFNLNNFGIYRSQTEEKISSPLPETVVSEEKTTSSLHIQWSEDTSGIDQRCKTDRCQQQRDYLAKESKPVTKPVTLLSKNKGESQPTLFKSILRPPLKPTRLCELSEGADYPGRSH